MDKKSEVYTLCFDGECFNTELTKGQLDELLVAMTLEAEGIVRLDEFTEAREHWVRLSKLDHIVAAHCSAECEYLGLMSYGVSQ